MKILHIVRQFYPSIGGLEDFTLNLAAEQKTMGHDVSVLTLNRLFSNNEVLPGADIYHGIAIKRIPYYGSRRYPIALSCVAQLNDADIVHIHAVDFFVDYLVLLKPFHGKKIILHTHGGYFHTKKNKLFKIIYFNLVTRSVLKGCYKVIACSKSDYQLFRRISNKVVRIDNGVNVDLFSKIVKEIEPGRLLYVGRISANKRIDNLIKACSAASKKYPGIKLRILGPDTEGLMPSLERLADRIGFRGIHFLGTQPSDSLTSELAKAHFFVSASDYEGFGISVVEAMAAGTVSILNNMNAFQDITENGELGILTDFNDTEKAADTILKAVHMDRDQYKAMAVRAKEAAAKYSWKKVASVITDLYK